MEIKLDVVNVPTKIIQMKKSCKGCNQMREYLEKGLCISCTRGPGGDPKEIKHTPSKIPHIQEDFIIKSTKWPSNFQRQSHTKLK